MGGEVRVSNAAAACAHTHPPPGLSLCRLATACMECI